MLIGIMVSSIALKPITRTANTCLSTVENMGIDHLRFDITMAQKFLDRSNAVCCVKWSS